MQQGLALAGAAEGVAGVAGLADLGDVTAHGAPAGDLAGVILALLHPVMDFDGLRQAHFLAGG